MLRLLQLLWCRRFVRLVDGFVGLRLFFAIGAGVDWRGLSLC